MLLGGGCLKEYLVVHTWPVHMPGADLGCIHDWHGGCAGSMYICLGAMDDVQVVHGALLDQCGVAGCGDLLAPPRQLRPQRKGVLV